MPPSFVSNHQNVWLTSVESELNLMERLYVSVHATTVLCVCSAAGSNALPYPKLHMSGLRDSVI